MVGIAAAVWILRVLLRLGTWAAGRSISPNSLSGISLLAALCAAAWFSGGTSRDSARGAFAMIGWLALLAIARWLAVFVSRRNGAEPAAASRAYAGPAAAFGWAWSVSAAAGECAIYGGLAAGNAAAGLASVWPLAIGTVIAVATAELLGACVAVELDAGPVERSGHSGAGLRWTTRFLRLPATVRGSMALLGFAFAGAEGAFFVALALSVMPIAVTVAMLGRIAPRERRVAVQRPASVRRPVASPSSDAVQSGFSSARQAKTGRAAHPAPGRTAPGPTSGISIVSGPRSQARSRAQAGPGSGNRVRGSAEPGPMTYASGIMLIPAAEPTGSEHQADVAAAGGGDGPSTAGYPEDAWGPDRIGDAGTGPASGSDASRGEAKADGPPSHQVHTHAAARDAVVALRDDGAAARWAGRLVQGNLIPLPPAFAGLVATSLLAVLGLRNLAAFVVLTPPVVMMLAAPGSSHPHDRRFDWLVPVLLALAQYVYLAPLGFALKVPAPVIFAVCALTFLWYTGLIANAAAGSGERTSIGWETRMFVVGLAATFGFATFGYLGVATYAGVLICRKVMTGYLVPGEEDRQ